MSAKSNIMKFPEKTPYVPCGEGTYTPCKLPKDVPDFVKEVRAKAFERFLEQGLPTQKLERFKYSNVAKAVAEWDGDLAPLTASYKGEYGACAMEMAKEHAWAKDLLLADPPGLEKYGDGALWDLNTAYLKYGGCIDIPAGEIVKEPLVMYYKGVDDDFTSMRFIMRVGDNAEVTFIEEFEGEGNYWRNHVCQFVLGKNAKLNHIRIIKDSFDGVYTQTSHVHLERDANYECFSLTMGAGFSRHQVQADLNGVNGHASFNGLNLLNGKQHADTTILINHRAANCQSNQFYRSIIDDSAHGVFQGKVHVYEDAQKTDGYQLSNTILLSDKAQMDTKPELEIYADDVKCSHGATTGQLDEEPLFYLRSRGLSEKDARFLLVQAFVGEILDQLGEESVRELIEKDVTTWLQTVL